MTPFCPTEKKKTSAIIYAVQLFNRPDDKTDYRKLITNLKIKKMQ